MVSVRSLTPRAVYYAAYLFSAIGHTGDVSRNLAQARAVLVETLS